MIAYISDKGFSVYTLDSKGDTLKYEYRYGKRRKTGTFLREKEENDATLDYLIDSAGNVLYTQGRLFDGRNGGEGHNYISYEYNDKNLKQLSLFSKKQQAEFIEAMGEWEQKIFDEDINYDQRMGVFSQVNPESKWLLVKSYEELLPLLHLSNNVTRIYKNDSNKGFRDFDSYPPVNVTYTYQYNDAKYPQKMELNINNDQFRVFTINYKKANILKPKETPAELSLSNKKLLPKSIKMPEYSILITYDNSNRITSIKKIDERGETPEVMKFDSIIYKKDSYIVFGKDSINYRRVDNKIIIDDADSGTIEYSFTPNGMLSRIVSKPTDYDSLTSIDPPIIIGYIYDQNNNLVDMNLPNNASGDRVNRSLQMIYYDIMKYDKKNGIFKYVNRDSFFLLYDMSNEIPFFYFMGNNYLGREDGFQDDEDLDEDLNDDIRYEYNEYDYPVRMNEQIVIEYIDAKE